MLGHPLLGLRETVNAWGWGEVRARIAWDHGRNRVPFGSESSSLPVPHVSVLCPGHFAQARAATACFVATHLQTRGPTWLACTDNQAGVEGEGCEAG